MTISELKKLEHVKVSVSKAGMATVTVDDGYCLARTEKQTITPAPDENGILPEAEEQEVTITATTLYCRKDTVLPEYHVEAAPEEATEAATEAGTE